MPGGALGDEELEPLVARHKLSHPRKRKVQGFLHSHFGSAVSMETTCKLRLVKGKSGDPAVVVSRDGQRQTAILGVDPPY